MMMTVRKIPGMLGGQVIRPGPGFLLLLCHELGQSTQICGGAWSQLWPRACRGPVEMCPQLYPHIPGTLWRCVPKATSMHTGILGLLTEVPLQPCWS